MTLFYVLYVRRSDGTVETEGSRKQKEKNEPTPDQLDQTPNAQGVSDYYRPLGDEEPKNIDWRRKLGGMLAREIGGPDYKSDKAYILHALPLHYRLYEHIKSKSGDNGEPRAKNHAGGGHDRQDAYLYGHPSGRKKRFRSPADFFPHLLWLATDSEGDPMNCACKICSPDDLQPEVPKAVATGTKKDTSSAARTSLPPPPAKLPEVQVVVERPQSQKSSKPPVPVAVTPSPAAPTQKSVPANIAPSPAPKPDPPAPPPQPLVRNVDQQLDFIYNRLIFRAGEIVWFHKGPAWGLGVIARRWWARDGGGEKRGYLVQPLSYPTHHPPQVHIADEKSLRPWLAWSAPNYTNELLNNTKVSYETADWDGILAKRYGQGDAEVDGSILAARATDSTYKPGQFIGRQPRSATSEARYYNFIFLGGEKIWAGEPVRTRQGSGTDILIISSIEEVWEQAPNAKTPMPVGLVFNGDMYQQVTVPLDKQAAIPNSAHLPQRMQDELRFRNSITGRTKQLISYWKQTASAAQVRITDIKGRWYESSLVMPLLDNDYFQNSLKTGDIGDCNAWMNGRGDASTDQPLMPRDSNVARAQALTQAFPPNFEVVDGFQPPFAEELAAVTGQGTAAATQEQPQKQQQQQYVQGANDFEQLMDIDGIGQEGMQGFGGEYPAQEHFSY